MITVNVEDVSNLDQLLDIMFNSGLCIYNINLNVEIP